MTESYRNYTMLAEMSVICLFLCYASKLILHAPYWSYQENVANPLINK